VKIKVQDRSGNTCLISADGYHTLMPALRDATPDIAGSCGGLASCGSCHIYVAEEYMSKLRSAQAHEIAMLECLDGVKTCSRLSCQIELTPDLDGIEITVAAGS